MTEQRIKTHQVDIDSLPEKTTPSDLDTLLLSNYWKITWANIKASLSSNGWNSAGETWTYASASTFTVPGDVTAKYVKGTRIKWTQTTVKYGVVLSSSYSAPNTTVTIAVNNDYVITNAAISANYYSYSETPLGFPYWFNYTPTYTCSGSMTFTSVVTTIARYHISSNTCRVQHNASGTTGGTASNQIRVSNPVTNTDASAVPGFGNVRDATSGAVRSGTVQNNPATDDTYVAQFDNSNWTLGASRVIQSDTIYGI